MAGAFRIAEGYVEVTADESGYDRAMDRLRSKRNTVGVQLRLDDRDARTQLDRFARDRSLKVKVNLDQSALSRLRLQDLTVNLIPQLQESARRQAEQQLGLLARDRTVRFIADADTRAAADDLALLARARTARVTADADTAAAAARLAALTRDRTVTIRTRTIGGLGGLAGIGGSAGSSAGGVSRLASSLSSLAELYRTLGYHEKAAPLFERALAIREKTLGTSHPAVARTLQSLAMLHQAEGNYGKAERLYGRSLGILETALGPNHPDVATVLSNHALLLRRTNRKTQAEGLEIRVRAILGEP